MRECVGWVHSAGTLQDGQVGVAVARGGRPGGMPDDLTRYYLYR